MASSTIQPSKPILTGYIEAVNGDLVEAMGGAAVALGGADRRRSGHVEEALGTRESEGTTSPSELAGSVPEDAWTARRRQRDRANRVAGPPAPASGGVTSRPIGERAALAAVIVACAVWGASFLLAKVALEELPIGHLVLWRFAIAAAVLLPLVLRRGLPLRRDLPRYAVSGLLCVPITFLPQFEGLARTTVASASLLVGTGKIGRAHV